MCVGTLLVTDSLDSCVFSLGFNEFDRPYQCTRWYGKTCIRNDVLCVEWNITLLTDSLFPDISVELLEKFLLAFRTGITSTQGVCKPVPFSS